MGTPSPLADPDDGLTGCDIDVLIPGPALWARLDSPTWANRRGVGCGSAPLHEIQTALQQMLARFSIA
jgi:hypothetical protein